MNIKIICQRCGHEMISIVYPTNPPQSGNKCTNCGREVRDESKSWSSNKEPIYIITK
jgi:hypothetical protein